MTGSVVGARDWRNVTRRLRADRRCVIAAGVLIAMVTLVLVGPLLSAYRPYEQLDITNLVHARPSSAHPLGTDAFSRDVLSRVMSGGRISLAVAASAVFIEVLVGVMWGLASGLAGAHLDTVMMRVVDAGMSVPRVLHISTCRSLLNILFGQ